MALIKCPECGKQISDKAVACIYCGFPMAEMKQNEQIEIEADKENDEMEEESKQNNEETESQNTETYGKSMLIIGGIALALIASILTIQSVSDNNKQKGLANRAISCFNAEEYTEALSIKQSLKKDTLLGDYNEKITLMGNLQEYLQDEDEQLSAIFYYLGNYKEFENNNLVEIAYPQIISTAQIIANQNVDFIYNVESYIKKEDASDKEEETRSLLEPLLTEDKDFLLKLAHQIDDEIDYELAKKEYEKYKKELAEQIQREYDYNNPIQMTNNDYKIVKNNGYYYCRGTVHNVSNTTHYYVKVKVTYYDKEKEVLTTDWTYAVGSEGINGGENQQFEIMTKVSGHVGATKCEILEWD